MSTIESMINEQKEALHIHESAFLDASQVLFTEEVRSLCEKNSCGLYGKSWACPPAVGTLQECEARCKRYEHAFVFTTLTQLEDMYDFEKWIEAKETHEEVTTAVEKLFRTQYDDILVLSVEGCRICETCTYPDKPCRFPDRMHPAAEGHGILVTELAKTAGIHYINGQNTLTYFSVIFY